MTRRRRSTTMAWRSTNPTRHLTITGISNEKLGMWVFLGSECLLFGGLISTYLLYKNRPGEIAGLSGSPVKPPTLFDIPLHLGSSFVLLASLTMVLAVTAAIAPNGQRDACGSAPPPRSARSSSPARSTSSPRSCARASASPRTSSARRSSRSPVSTAST